MSRLRWNNQILQARPQTSVFPWREGWMARTIPRPRWREKNVLDIPFYRSGHYTQNLGSRSNATAESYDWQYFQEGSAQTLTEEIVDRSVDGEEGGWCEL